MARKSDQLAASFDTENTGGVLSGLLADEENFDRRAMWRLGTWGVASVGAVIVAVLANQSAIRNRRDEVAALDLSRQSMQIQSVARESQNETRRLASAIDTLNGDRDRLYSRLTTVEQGLDSVTGAIAKQNAAATPPAAAPQPLAQTGPAEPTPVPAPVATVSAAMTDKPHGDARKSTPLLAATVAAATPTPAPSSSPAATSSVPVLTSRSMMAPPDPAAPKLVEPEPPAKTVTAVSAPTPSPAPEATAPAPAATAIVPAPADKPVTMAKADPVTSPLAVKRTEFGVDVGGANSVSGLRALWRGLLKSRSNAPLAALQPIIVVKEANNGLGMQLRLVAGPLSDAAAAARICAAIAENERPCETTVFDGQRLALKAEEASASTESISAKPGSDKPSTEKTSADKPSAEKPSSDKPSPDRASIDAAPDKSLDKPAAKLGSNRYFHRRGAYASSSSRRAAVEETPPAKKPESGTISSFFSNRLHPQTQ